MQGLIRLKESAMKLEFIRLINFRQYYGEHTADFSIFGDLNVTVFHGLNGAGKTSLFSAINWCLYDEGIDDIGQLLSKPAVVYTDEGKSIPCVVSIGFMHKGKKFVAERAAEYIKSGNSFKHVKTDFTLTRIPKAGDSETIPNPVGFMNSILPSNVRQYFFFDGEKMDDLTKANSNDIEDAVRNIMRLPTLERAQAHLEEIAGEFRREIKNRGSQELEDLISQEEQLRSRKEEYLKRRIEVKDEIRIGRQQIDDIDNQLRGTEAAKALQTRRDSLTETLINLERREEDKVKIIQKYANRNYVTLISTASLKALEIVNQKRDKGEIPSGIREQFIKDLIERGTCICGRNLSSDKDSVVHLEKLLKRTSSTKTENEVLKLGGNIQSLSSNSANWSEAINENCHEHSNIQENIKRLEAELDDVKRQLIGISIEHISELERKRIKFQANLESNLSEVGRIESNLKYLEEQLVEVLKKRGKAEKNQAEIALLVKKESLSQRAADAVHKIKEEFFEQTRKEIEKATKEVFSRLAWKSEQFQDVQLDQNFRLEVIDRWGTPTRKELSAGERQILSLAFITAISKLSGEEAPLVMDTPFGRLSGNHLTAVAENLPELTPQLILFVTDREWDEASKTKLEPKSGAQYNLCFDQHTGCTKIEEVCYE